MLVATVCQAENELRRGGRFLLIATADGLHDQPHANRLGAHLDANDPAAHHRPHLLNIGLELARGNAGDLGAYSAQILGLAAMGLLAPKAGLLTCEKTYAWH